MKSMDQDAGEGRSKGGWIAKLAEELAGGANTHLAVGAAEELPGPASNEHGHAAAGYATTVAEELLRGSQLVLAFPQGSGSALLSVHQASPTGAQAVVVCLSEAGAPNAQQRPLAAFTLPGAAAVLAGASVPEWCGGLCRPYLLVRATTGQLRLLEALPQQRRARTVWDVPDTPQVKGELVQPLVRFGAGPSVVLPFSSGELWVACNYGGPQPGLGLGQPPGASGWQLHRLRVGVGSCTGSALVPCAVWPCWGPPAGPCGLAGLAGGLPSASTATAAGHSAGMATGSGGVGPFAASSAVGSGLQYCLAALASVGQQQGTPQQHQEQQGKQQQGEQAQAQAQGSMMLVCLQLTPGSCPSNACYVLPLPPLNPLVDGGVGDVSAAACLIPQQHPGGQGHHSRAMLAVSTHSGQVHLLALAGLPAGECLGAAADGGGAVAPVAAWQQHRLAEQGGSSAQVSSGPAAWTASATLPAPASQLAFVRGAQVDKGYLVAVCGGGSSVGGGSCARVLTWPALDCIAQVQQEVVGCWLEGGTLLCSLQPGIGDGSVPGMPEFPEPGRHATPLPLALLLRQPPGDVGESGDMPLEASPPTDGAAFAFLPVRQVRFDLGSTAGKRGQGRQGRQELLPPNAITLAQLHHIVRGQAGNIGQADDGDAQRGLLKVISSLQRHVDEGHIQAGNLRQLAAQKQRAIAAGSALLAQCCRGTWEEEEEAAAPGGSGAVGAVEAAVMGAKGAALPGGRSGGGGSLAAGDIVVESASAERTGVGQWLLRVVVQGLPSLAGAQRPAFLVASSPTHLLSCSQHTLRIQAPTTSITRHRRSNPQPHAMVELSCTLTVRQPQQAAAGGPFFLMDPEGLWVDVGMVVGSGEEVLLAPLAAGPAGSSFVSVGRVQLPLFVDPQSSALQPRPPQQGHQQQQQQQPGSSRASRAGGHHRAVIAVRSEGVELRFLHSALLQLGAIPAPQAPAYGAQNQHAPAQQHRMVYSLPAVAGNSSASEEGSCGTVTATWHSACFVELAFQAADQLLLSSAVRLLEHSMQAMAQRAGGSVTVQPSVLGAQQAQRAAEAAGALLAEADALCSKVEGLLRERLALQSRVRGNKEPCDLGGVLCREAQALEAAAAADVRLAQLAL